MIQVKMIAFQQHLCCKFAELNMAWLQKYFVVEPLDHKILSDPKTYIIDNGGYIFFAMAGKNVAGTFALIKINGTEYELSKMAVDEALRGNKIGNAMLQFCLEEAGKLLIKKLVLYSNTKLKPAIHLYSKYGFKEVPLEKTEYERANIKMEKDIINNQ